MKTKRTARLNFGNSLEVTEDSYVGGLAKEAEAAVRADGRLPASLSNLIPKLSDYHQMALLAEMDQQQVIRYTPEEEFNALQAAKGQVMRHIRLPQVLTDYYEAGVSHLIQWLDDRCPPNLIRTMTIGKNIFRAMGEETQKRWVHLNARLVTAGFGLPDPVLDPDIPPPAQYDDQPGKKFTTLADVRMGTSGVGIIRYNMPGIRKDFVGAAECGGETGAHEASHIIEDYVAGAATPRCSDFMGTFLLAAQGLRHSGLRGNKHADYWNSLNEQLARWTEKKFGERIRPKFCIRDAKVLFADRSPKHHACLKRALASARMIRSDDPEIQQCVADMDQLYRHWGSDAHWLDRDFVWTVTDAAIELKSAIECQAVRGRDMVAGIFLRNLEQYLVKYRQLHQQEIYDGETIKYEEFMRTSSGQVDDYMQQADGELNELRASAKPVMRGALNKCLQM